MKKSFVIDCFPESALRYKSGWSVVAIDVIRATTMAVTAASLGRRCYPVDTLEAAMRLSSKLTDPLLAGEINGDMPDGFDLNNSPAELVKRMDLARPLIMLSSSGTRLIINATGSDAVYLACFRNYEAVARRLVEEKHRRIAIIGAGSRQEFREEDQIGCAWIAAHLVQAGYAIRDNNTAAVIDRWASAQAVDCLVSHSVDYLRRSAQLEDVEFILDRVNDLDEVSTFDGTEVLSVRDTNRAAWAIPSLVPDSPALPG